MRNAKRWFAPRIACYDNLVKGRFHEIVSATGKDEMGESLHIVRQTQRFDWALKCLPSGPRQPFDVDLYRFEEAAVTPTVGAITPAWLLVIPRVQAYCFADVPHPTRERISALIGAVRNDMLVFDKQLYLLEHGARCFGSSIGCGVDQAHAHLVGLPNEFLQATLLIDPTLQWQEISTMDPWSWIEREREYYFVTDFSKAFVSYPERRMSQYFRRVIARGLSRPAEWDYRLFPNERNVKDTIRLIDRTPRRRTAA